MTTKPIPLHLSKGPIASFRAPEDAAESEWLEPFDVYDDGDLRLIARQICAKRTAAGKKMPYWPNVKPAMQFAMTFAPDVAEYDWHYFDDPPLELNQERLMKLYEFTFNELFPGEDWKLPGTAADYVLLWSDGTEVTLDEYRQRLADWDKTAQ